MLPHWSNYTSLPVINMAFWYSFISLSVMILLLFIWQCYLQFISNFRWFFSSWIFDQAERGRGGVVFHHISQKYWYMILWRLNWSNSKCRFCCQKQLAWVFLSDLIYRQQCLPWSQSHTPRHRQPVQSPVQGNIKFKTFIRSVPFWNTAVTRMSASFSMAALISSPMASSGHLRSSRMSPVSSMRERKSSLTPISWKSLRFTFGTSMLWVEGQMSSSFLPSSNGIDQQKKDQS